MIDAVAQRKNPNCFIYFGIGNLSNFAIVKSLYKFGSCLVGNYCDFFYIGQTEELKQRPRKHKSDVIHSNNSNCNKRSEYLKTCSKMKESFFNIYPFLYEENKYL